MWGGVQRGLGSIEERFGWLLDVGAVVELYQWQHSSLLAVSGMQLNADTHNEISFNPSGVIWEEHLMYATRGEGTNWQFGFAQRCRHDVDNLDIKKSTGEAQQRTLIYSSISGKVVFERATKYGLDVNSSFDGDLYVIAQDYRLPKSTSASLPNMERLIGSAGFTSELSFSGHASSGLYLTQSLTASLFAAEGGIFRKFASVDMVDMDYRMELGYLIPGRGGRMRIFAGWESLADDGTMPIPEHNQYFFLGVRITGSDLFY
jgi:hypothetical protein